jgi:xanthine dehydrogenase accessory factor
MDGEKILESLYAALMNQVKEGNKCVMLTYLDFHKERQGSIEKKVLFTSKEIELRSIAMSDELYNRVCLCLDNGKLELLHLAEDKALLIEPYMPKPNLIIFGGGHIAKPLSEFAARIGFSVTVIDDRPFFANRMRFPEADKVICESFEKSFDLLCLKETDFVVIITRGHRHDGVVLREILKHTLSYIGMIGSKRRVKSMKEELAIEGFPQDKLDSLNAPIGLDIGAITPDEIAISIVSQLIGYKNKVMIDKFGKDFTYPEFDMEVAEAASKKTASPKALITILSSKGSVPRKAGAKMVAFFDGRTVGSIGGGCSEASVISNAKDLMLEKGFHIEHVDLTGDAAESEGMVCGGLMDVLIEAY